MKQIVKKLFQNIKYLVNWQHNFFYLFLIFIILYFSISDYKEQSIISTINYNNILYSLGKSVLLSISVSFISFLIGLIFFITYISKKLKIIKNLLDSIFIFPEILYLFILLFLYSPITLYKFILITSVVRAYSFFNMIISEIEELESKEFITALYSIGLKRIEILRRHILPTISIPIFIFFLETIIWFIVIEFTLTFINIANIYKNPSIGTMLNHFIQNKNYQDSIIIILISYSFIFELNYIISNIKLRFEISFKKET